MPDEETALLDPTLSTDGQGNTKKIIDPTLNTDGQGNTKKIIALGVSVLGFIIGIVIATTVLEVFDKGSTRDEDIARTVVGLVVVLLIIFAIIIVVILWPFVKNCLRS